MDSDSKSPKVLKHTSDDQEDRLSSLPVFILCHILSFLPTKHAARTSILSKKWEYIFLGVSKINLDDSLLFYPLQRRGTWGSNEDFIDFVNRQLMLCKTSSIIEFRLKCIKLPKVLMLYSWITTLLWRKVQVLEIEVRQGSDCASLPTKIFSCETLVVLKLWGQDIVLKVPELVYLSNLKILHLQHLAMQCESTNLRLAGCYPLLEELRMSNVEFQKIGTLVISIPTLRKFAFNGENNPEGLRRIDIDTPHLQYFEYYCHAPPTMDLNICKCESLLQADLLVLPNIPFLPRLELTGPKWFSNFFRNIYNVTAVKVSWIFLEDLFECTGSLPQFPNLTHVEITANGNCDSKLMWILLECAPNLETLVCHMTGGSKETDCFFCAPEIEPLCLAQKLSEIRIKHFDGYKFELELVRYLLEHGAVLERMLMDRQEKWPSPILRQLLTFTRGSPECKILIS